MGTWGVGLYTDDTASDVRDTWLKKLRLGASGEEATAELIEEWKGADDEPLFWLALADLQWRWGRLEAHVRERALRVIADGGDLELWEGNEERGARVRVFKSLAARLETPPPAPRRVRVRGDAVTWKRGQLWSYSTLDGNKVILRVTAVDPKGGIVPGPVVELLDVIFEGDHPPDGLEKVGLRPARADYNATGYYDFIWPEHRASPMFMPKVMQRGGLPRHRLKKLRARGEPRLMEIGPTGYVGLPWWYLDNFLADKFDVGGPRVGAIHAWPQPDGATAYTVVEFAYWGDTDTGPMWQLGVLDCRDPSAPAKTLEAAPIQSSIVVQGVPPAGMLREVGRRAFKKGVVQVTGAVYQWRRFPQLFENPDRFVRNEKTRKAAEESIARRWKRWIDSPSDRITPDDPRYRAVVDKRFNKRFTATPDYVRLARSTDDVLSAVGDAVREGRRLVVTSGGHCLEGFVSDPDVKVIIDVSPMKGISFDAARAAISVEAGATVGETFRALAETWGVVVPLGEYPGIGMGGHVAGGAFGFLCRQLGLAADYLHAVEVVTVDPNGQPRAVVATREPSDPNHELWWALTGAGAGNFGVVTRFWFRSPGASGADPARLLPRAPESITTFRAEWSWDDIDRPAFVRLCRNHGLWSEQTRDADEPHANLWTLLALHRKQLGKIIVRGVSTAGDGAPQQIDDCLAALGDGTVAAGNRAVARMSWLDFALNPFPDMFAMPPGGVSTKVKDALLKKRFTDRQLDVAYDHLTSADHDVMGGMLGLASTGGAINRVAPDATASAQRDAILDIACNAGWLDPGDEAKNLAWVRGFYRDLFADDGGVPVPGDAYAGAFINHPDTDLADPTLNTSGVPWHALYFRGGYPRLQRVKARFDPRDVFRHTLSIRGA